MKLFLSTKKLKPEYRERFDGVFLHHRTSSGDIYPLPEDSDYVTVSVFGDTKGLRKNPERAAVAEDGEKALLGVNKYDGFAWSWVCPTEPENRRFILDLISRIPIDKVVILEDFQFPNERYCYCERCKSDRVRIGAGDISEWRVNVITEFWRELLETRSGRYALTIHPDPYGLRERYGIDLEVVKNRIEFLHIPIYCTTYALTYWMDILIPAILKEFNNFQVFMEVYAVEPSPMQVLKALFILSKYKPDGIVLYDYVDKHIELARLVKEDETVKKLIQEVKNPVFKEIVERIRAWV